MSFTQNKIKVYTDGSCLGNPGKGGASAVFVNNGKVVFSRVAGEKSTTNNRMELTGLILAVETINTLKIPAIIYTDSEYSLKGITVWYKNWQKRNWKKSDGKQVLNADLWKQLVELVEKSSEITFEKIKAHSGDTFNDLADLLAKESANLI